MAWGISHGTNTCCCSNLWLLLLLLLLLLLRIYMVISRSSSSIVAAYARQWIVRGCVDAGELQQQLRYEAWLAVKDVLLLEEGARKARVEPAGAASTCNEVSVQATASLQRRKH
jgi:hypothetical protein